MIWKCRWSLPKGRAFAHIRWLPESDWLVVRLEARQPEQAGTGGDGAMQQRVEELLQERETTYRNLLAAYLRLQEVNRQKTVFLASAAHELKTPLAVIKGYYDLLLSGSLGKLTDKQRDILQESKESCERLVRLVSMFLNYSALESGKLVMHLRENDMRDCLVELTTRWREAFVRKNVRLEVSISADTPIFTFDYQKMQQTVANLLDNALKHTPVGRLRDAHLRADVLGEALNRGSGPRRAAPGSQCARRTACACRSPTRALASRPSIIRKFSRILFAWTGPPPGWGWGWRSRRGWCRRIEGSCGWIANCAVEARLRFSCRSRKSERIVRCEDGSHLCRTKKRSWLWTTNRAFVSTCKLCSKWMATRWRRCPPVKRRWSAWAPRRSRTWSFSTC